jgi:hypothetical protein
MGTNLTDPPDYARCTATANRSGLRCRRAAISGGNVCRSHGGAAPAVRRAAAQRAALQRAAGLLDPDSTADPTEVLVAAVRASAALLGAAETAVQSEDADPAALHELGEAAMLAAKISKAALDAGLEARLTRQAERNGQIVGAVITKVVNQLELPAATTAGVFRLIRAEFQTGSLDLGRYAGMSLAQLDHEVARVVDELDRLDAQDAVEGFPARLAGCLDAALGVLDLDDGQREVAVVAAEAWLAERATEQAERERQRRHQAGSQAAAWSATTAHGNGGRPKYPTGSGGGRG